MRKMFRNPGNGYMTAFFLLLLFGSVALFIMTLRVGQEGIMARIRALETALELHQESRSALEHKSNDILKLVKSLHMASFNGNRFSPANGKINASSSLSESMPKLVLRRYVRESYDKSNPLFYFQQQVSQSEKELLMEMLAVLDRACSKHNITYLLYGGSLLGSYRHHDLIPWDDDVDLLFNIQEKAILFKALSQFAPEYYVNKAGPRLKFFSKNSNFTTKYSWRWPYLDLHFYKENQTHIWDSSYEFRNYIYKKSNVFPLHRRPFGNVYANAPYDSYAVLRKTYKSSKCQTYFYSHKKEVGTSARMRVIPCEDLSDLIPFVHRTSVDFGIGVKETLKLGQETLQVVIVDEPSYAISKPYKLELVEGN
ncbi:uncharacterized protein LOC106156013 [Lingula anatina]|uniref:Uncharacterized protein LOC106156013 n=1 Tax=Lingula anatina TaxID=7574 RepID=A0A1S3HKI0_LINAN|nr:uncharacterized protein LOC106156013 [Lingula anatina]XP_013386529.1 uncharacterized protein LOC106156013 [Lingula anatina]XP_013386530.1 uncharacterized protein LOC106156013 [Lingula anatina]XP_013386531.1 uncharacterized protein LOC106156013 [Lingula anatina]XP_013386532.1 uncharacterized protein LOC106156013 [Lingula anatina]XP_013386533.1 uncharacterized protein LOC106156013 [Lingula anatina]|eukprot:XP_013386528.1 uncharacterized protein LOC106156013 [Lingula anatina]